MKISATTAADAERIACEANKKVSFRQRSSVEQKTSISGGVLSHVGMTFSFPEKDVVQSALFDRITRDCRGEVIRKSSVRRFRQVGSDEWFSLPADSGNAYWENNFAKANLEDTLAQEIRNNTAAREPEVASAPVVDTPQDLATTPMQDKGLASSRNTKIIIIGTVIIIGIAVGYKIYTKNK